MKKFIALTLTGLLALCGSTAVTVTAATSSQDDAAAQNLYLVPGTYTEGGAKVENTVSGATKLTGEQCAEINTDNAYLCTLAAGEKLPAPASTRKDGEGNAYTFNGWWSIVDATVTYFETVPEIAETTFLYADWRADLSQRKDPVTPDESTTVKPNHYMSVYRAETKETEIITLLVSGTDMMNAETLGYGAPVQLYNDWFMLNPGDVITVYTAGLNDAKEAQVAPLMVSGRAIQLESSGDGSNHTSDYLTANVTPIVLKQDPTVTYKNTLEAGHFRIYIKFYFGGSQMNVYMEQLA